MPTNIRIRTSGWRAASGDKSPVLDGPVAEDRVLPDRRTPLDYNNIGELINESQIVSSGKRSAGFSIKGHHSKKDGIAACLPAAKAVTAHSKSFDGQSALTGGLSSSYLGEIRISGELGGAS